MGFSELINLLKQQNESGKGFLIHLNTDDLEEKSCRNTGIEFADLYFTNCTMIRMELFLYLKTSTESQYSIKRTERRYIRLIATAVCTLMLRKLKSLRRYRMILIGS